MRESNFTLAAALLLPLVLAAPGRAQAQAPVSEAGRQVVTLDHPSQPARLRLTLVTGNVSVTSSSGPDVVVTGLPAGPAASESQPLPAEAAGMHRLSSGGMGTVREHNNVVVIGPLGLTRSQNVSVQVPAHTSLNLHVVNGRVNVTGVVGDIDIQDVNGAITLNHVGGSIVAHGVNGKITAAVDQLDPKKPSAFSSLNGAIDLTLPADIHADLRIQTDQGQVFMDNGFQFQPSAGRGAGLPPAGSNRPLGLRPTPPGAPAPPNGSLPPGAPAPPPGPPPPPSGRGARIRARAGRALIARRFALHPPIAGTLNGGGTEIRIRDFNGNVFVRKGK